MYPPRSRSWLPRTRPTQEAGGSSPKLLVAVETVSFEWGFGSNVADRVLCWCRAAPPSASLPSFPPFLALFIQFPHHTECGDSTPDRTGVFPESEQRGRLRRAFGEGGRNTRLQGCLGRRSSPGTWRFSDLRPRARPSPPVFTLRKTLHLDSRLQSKTPRRGRGGGAGRRAGGGGPRDGGLEEPAAAAGVADGRHGRAAGGRPAGRHRRAGARPGPPTRSRGRSGGRGPPPSSDLGLPLPHPPHPPHPPTARRNP